MRPPMRTCARSEGNQALCVLVAGRLIQAVWPCARTDTCLALTLFALLLRDADGQAPAACCLLPPPLGLADFETALRQHQPSSHHAQQYRAADLARTQVRHLSL